MLIVICLLAVTCARADGYLPCGDSVFWWSVMMAESGGNPRSVYHEPPPLNEDSIGLYQLSVSDSKRYPGCPTTKNELYDPVLNTKCKDLIAAKLRKLYPHDNWSASLGKYWSTLRRKPEWPKDYSGYLSFKKFAATKNCVIK